MVVSRYAGVGTNCPLLNIDVIGSGNLLSSGALYFSFQLQNRAGYNIPSVSGIINYVPSQKIVITIPTSIRKNGYDIHYVIISAGSNVDPSTHVQLARYPGYQFGVGIDSQTLLSNLPATIELSLDQHISLAGTVATLNDLPTGIDRLDGQTRWVTSESKWFEYRADSSLNAGTNVIVADIGRWVRVASASSYIANSESSGGSDYPLVLVQPTTAIPTPLYPGDNGLSKTLPTWEAKYIIVNNNDVNIPEGTEFGIDLEYNDQSSPDLLNGLFMVEFKGYVRTDGSLRITKTLDGSEFVNIGGYIPWTPRLLTQFVTPDDVLPNESILIAVKPWFSAAELMFFTDYKNSSTGMVSGDVVSIRPVIRTQSGDYNPLGKLLNGSSVIYNLGEKYKVLPSTGLSYRLLSGSALVQNYDFPLKPSRDFTGLIPSSANQKIVINGNGAVFNENSSYSVQTSEALRALVSTLPGESAIGVYSSYLSSGGNGFNITLNYPCNSSGMGTIRSNYPGGIAGSIKGDFNPHGVNIYIERQDTLEIRKFTGNLVVPNISQVFTVLDWNDGTTSSLPNLDFGLFSPNTASLVTANSGNFPVTNYRVAYSFIYDGNQITDINHSSPPCIYEWDGDFQPPSVTVASTITLQPGQNAAVVNVGSGNAAQFEFYIPRGESTSITSTSITSNIIGTGSRTFALANTDSLGWFVGTRLRASSNSSNYVEGSVTALTNSSVTIISDNAVGSGTFVNWNITLTGDRGSVGISPNVTRTSTTANTIGTGNKTFTYSESASLGWLVGTRLRASNSVSNYIEGVVVSVTSTSVAIFSDNISGVGNFLSWNITLAGDTGTSVEITRTSATSNSIGTGTKTFNFVVTPNLGWLVGTRLRAANSVSDYIEGVVTSVTNTSVVILSDNDVGSGTFTSWNITLTGDRGAIGIGSPGLLGQNAFTTLSSGFNQPNVGNTSFINVINSSWVIIGQIIFIATGGYYQIIDIPNDTSLEVLNLGYPENAAVASSINVDSKISPGGSRGTPGITGSISSSAGLILTELSSAPVTALDQLSIFNKNNALFVRGESNAPDIEVALKKIRRSIVVTSEAIANGSHQQTTFTASPGFVCYQIETDKPARVRLYNNISKRSADVNRSVPTTLQAAINFNASFAGLLADLVTTVSSLVHPASPILTVATIPSTTSIPITITNLSGSTATVQVTLTIMEIE